MFKLYKDLGFRANKINDKEIQALFEDLLLLGKRGYFQQKSIDFFLLSSERCRSSRITVVKFLKIGWIEIAAQLIV